MPISVGEIIFEVLSLAGILAFAISGALVGVRRRLDLLGVIVVGSATGIGGGILRDVLLGVHPPVSFTHWPNVIVAVGGSLAVFYIHPGITRIRHFEVVFDAFGLGLFSANTAAAAFAAGETPLTAVFVGTITAIGGGVVRDVLVNTVPGVLTRELYAVSAIFGSVSAITMVALTASVPIASLIGGALAIALRLISIARGWHLPLPKMPADPSGSARQQDAGEGNSATS